MKRLLVTGSSGYLGSGLVHHFRQRDVQVLGIDSREPSAQAPDQFVGADICDPGLGALFQDYAPDTVIHAAFSLDPKADTKTGQRVNVRGSENVLRAVSVARPQRLLVVSSATAYGAWPDNPDPIHEDRPLRSRDGFRYAADKVEVERLVGQFAEQHAAIAVSCVRPAVIGSSRMDNYLRRVIFEMPFLIRLDGYDQPIQLVHEQDVIGAIDSILAIAGRGAFNIAPHDSIRLSELGAATGRWTIPIPFWFARACHRFTGIFRLPIAETHRDFLYFVRYPWIVSPDRLVQETGYQFRYSTHDTVQEIIGKEVQGQKEND